MKICGIYKIKSLTKNNKIYIGSSSNIYNRWSAHRRNLFYNRHPSKQMQNHYNKYGLDDFSFEIIEKCSVEDKLSREQYYLDTLKPFFNSNPVAGNTTGRVFSEETLFKLRNPSEETRMKLSVASKNRIHNKKPLPDNYISPLKGKKLSQDHIDKMRKSSNGVSIFQFDLNDNLIKIWPAIKTAAKSLGIKESGIRRCLSGRYKQSYGFVWKRL